MFGGHWNPGTATVVVSEAVINNKTGYAEDYVLDVQPADGSPMFRTTVRSPKFVGFMPQPAHAVVPVEINSKNNEVRFDMSSPQLSVKVKVDAEHSAFEAAATAPAGTAPTQSSSPSSTSGTENIAAALEELRSAVADVGAVTAGMAKERTNTDETLAAIKRARENGDLAEVDRLKAEWTDNNPQPS